jgi:hypothetical protein
MYVNLFTDSLGTMGIYIPFIGNHNWKSYEPPDNRRIFCAISTKNRPTTDLLSSSFIQ